MDVEVLYVFVLRKSNPRVQRSEELETAYGFDTKAYSGEFAPFLLYLKA